MYLVYSNSCPACHGYIEAHRLELGLPCTKCLPVIDERLFKSLSNLPTRNRLLTEILNNPGDYFLMHTSEEDLKAFERFFEKIIRGKMWSIQRMWSRRLLDMESFALIAPTGIGKSTLLQIYSLYMMNFNKKIYFILPTRQLASQTFERLKIFAERIGIDTHSIHIYDSSRGKSFIDLVNEIREKEASILITTSSLLSKRYNEIKDFFFDVIVADDLDAILKSSKNLDRVLELLGFSKEIIDYAFRISILSQELIYNKLNNKTDLVEKLREEIEVLRSKILSYRNSRRVGQLVVATATGRGGVKTKILREVLGFEAGGVIEYSRNIVDSYEYLRDKETLIGILDKLGRGTLIFISKSDDIEIRDLYKELNEAGLKVGIADSRTNHLKKFLNREIDYLIASASIYGVATRGLDAPHIIKNAVFINVPSYKISLDKFLTDPRKLFLIYRSLAKYFNEAEEISDDIGRLIYNRKLSELHIIRKILREEVHQNEYLATIIEKLRNYISTAKYYLLKLCDDQRIVIKVGVVYPCLNTVIIPDPITYIQASGRTSRLYNGSLTLGLSIVLYRDEELLHLFIKRLQKYLYNSVFKRFTELDLSKIKSEQDLSRSPSSISPAGFKSDVKSILMIVESPTKARTIAQIFGSRSKKIIGDIILREFSLNTSRDTYVVGIVPSLGHITDLVENEGFYGINVSNQYPSLVYGYIKRCLSCGYQFSSESNVCPRCGSTKIRDHSKTIYVLRRLAQLYDAVYIATDPDQEGEKIAYDVKILLRPYNNNIYRIEFHEVTREAILKAFENPRDINMRLVYSQIIRRVDDRLIGFVISRELQERYKMKWLGAGRVQTPVLSWVIEAYKKYLSERGFWVSFATEYSKVLGTIKIFVKSREEAERLTSEKKIYIERVERERRVISPPPPFTTDTLITMANSLLKLSPSVTMKIAQNLFESGLITYHRTDSTHVSDHGIRIAKQYIATRYSENLFKGRSWGNEGAHEAIRPTYPIPPDEILESTLSGEIPITKLDDLHKKIYDIIFRRFIASQMKEADIEMCKVHLVIGGYKTSIEGICSIYDEGFLKVYNYYKLLPSKMLDESSYIDVIDTKIWRGSSVKLLSSGEVIKLMKERGIGRPSTYAKAIENNKRHGYVIESKKRNYLIPTKTGLVIHDTLKKLYPEIINERATRILEEKIEKIASGSEEPDKVLIDILRDLRNMDLSNTRYQLERINEILSSLESSRSS
ncbi:MAG: reverse gyrase [Sulfolobales archaeon]